MLAFPNCKINLGLQVTAKRPDGYHEIQTVFYPLPIHDLLEIIQSDTLIFTGSGLPVPDNGDDNLCVKAWKLLKQDFPDLPAVSIHLHKTIPIGAGLGGGSADAAFTLKLLNEKFRLGLSSEKLRQHAATLGSDCAFFIQNKPSMATGRGECLSPVALNLSAYSWLLVCPPIHISTAWAYSHITPASTENNLQKLLAEPVTTWKDKVVNDFEKAVFAAYPEIARIRQRLYKEGALYAAMSGSGAAVFGLFPKNEIAGLVWETGYQVFQIK